VARDKWVVKDGAYEPIVSPRVFDQVQAMVNPWRKYRSDEEMITKCGRLYRRHGRLTAEIIAASRKVPSIPTIYSRFGSLRALYALIENRRPEEFSNVVKSARDSIVNAILKQFPHDFKAVKLEAWASWRAYLQFQGRVTFRLFLCKKVEQSRSIERWRPRFRARFLAHDPTILVLWNLGAKKHSGICVLFPAPNGMRHKRSPMNLPSAVWVENIASLRDLISRDPTGIKFAS
jgi:hypothetical protein